MKPKATGRLWHILLGIPPVGWLGLHLAPYMGQGLPSSPGWVPTVKHWERNSGLKYSAAFSGRILGSSIPFSSKNPRAVGTAFRMPSAPTALR